MYRLPRKSFKHSEMLEFPPPPSKRKLSPSSARKPLRAPRTLPTIKFAADQEWQVHIKASDAQKIMDVAVGAGANQISGVESSVADPYALEAKPYAAAIRRAKLIAEQSASQAGVKLGEILSISNTVSRFFPRLTLNTESATLSSTAQMTRTIPLTLYPANMERQASVTITYAIE
jgi:uncharacterized protein YggE